MRMAEHLAVRLNRLAVLNGPLVNNAGLFLSCSSAVAISSAFGIPSCME